MNNLEALTAERRKHVESCKKNDDNSHEIIAKMYSDPSHFIYELLQNADDAKASEVKFILHSKSLEFHHNGKKLFDFDDVKSITGINASAKKDDVNVIGTFGAGFKSVFAITKTPSIHSGDFHFEIVDFIVPEIVEPLNNEEKYETVICIPFNHPDISSEAVYKQISDRLQALESEALLFLRNIREIQWSTESDKGHYLAEIKDDKIRLISQVNKQDSPRDYLIFKKTIEIESAKLNIVVAYLLDADGGNTVVPVHDAKLFVFFPTEVQTGLKFLVHAPYKTTPGRETIPFDDEQNRTITNKLSMLIADSIQSIKDKGLLDVDFLTLLPIDSEKTHSLYSSAFQKVKNALTINALLPTSDSGYVNAKNALLAREKYLTTLLDSFDCFELFKRKTWLSTAVTYDKTKELRDYLMKILDIPEINMQEFCAEITDKFMETKRDEWVINFYSNITNNNALYREGTSYQQKGVLREREIIRLEDDSHLCPENDDGELQVYLPPKRNGKSRFKTVKRAIAENEEACGFLKGLGLGKPDDIAEIKEFIVSKYKNDDIKIDKDDYIQDFERVLEIWLRVDKYKKQEVSELLKSAHFMRCTNQNRQINFQQPRNVYFRTNKLSDWYEGNLDNDIYFLKAGIQLTENSRKFLESLGVRYDLKMFGTNDVIVDWHGWHERSVNGFNPDFGIHGLDFVLMNITPEKSVFLWSVLLKHTNKLKGYTEMTRNLSYPCDKSEEKTSKAMDALNKNSWLYGKDGELIEKSIDQITLDDLSDEYQKDDDNIEKLVKVLGLKLDIVAKFEEDNPGLKVVPEEQLEAFKEWDKAQRRAIDENTEKPDWTPKIDLDDAIIIEARLELKVPESKDLSGQDINPDKIGKERGNDGNSDKPKDSKAIGDCGEKLAYRYLVKKYPKNEVVWLNENGNIGKGYDFVIRENGEDITYFEVKSKTDEAPQLFQISGTQWNWAKELHNSKRGKMYTILLVSNVGKKEIRIKPINDPVALWKAGKLYADPINIKL